MKAARTNLSERTGARARLQLAARAVSHAVVGGCSRGHLELIVRRARPLSGCPVIRYAAEAHPRAGEEACACARTAQPTGLGKLTVRVSERERLIAHSCARARRGAEVLMRKTFPRLQDSPEGHLFNF